MEEDTSKLEDVLFEEQERSFRITAVHESEVSTLSKGYVRESGRNGYAYYYPQRREGDRVEG